MKPIITIKENGPSLEFKYTHRRIHRTRKASPVKDVKLQKKD